MLTIWIIGIIIFGMWAAYQYGKVDDKIQSAIALPLMSVVILWPLVLFAIIICSPFGYMIYLGDRAKTNNKKEK